ncbi:hypothetical protein TWF718_001120 [Orbilia javanica]|uniref:Uncharacterized protein n=1 Tax=Orbilia javanica TaxID=47235 RepID=A0AAN8N0T8_9PEZI
MVAAHLVRQFSQYATHGYRPVAKFSTSTIVMYGYLLGGLTVPFVAPAVAGRSDAPESGSTLGAFAGHCCSR